jgi:hypothetical protein
MHSNRSQGLTPLLLLAVMPVIAHAQVELLPPQIAAKLSSATERRLLLASDGEALRFRSGPERWEEALPPDIVDVDGDGIKDYIVQLLVDEESGRRALLAREWGAAADTFGRTVFYIIIEENDDVAEWAGNPRLDPPARARP